MSPYYETATILQRVLGDGNLADALRQQSVTSIVLTGENTWEVKSQECTATVTIEFVAAPANEPAMGGGPNFDVKVGASSHAMASCVLCPPTSWVWMSILTFARPSPLRRAKAISCVG